MIKRLSFACLGILSMPLAAQDNLPPPGGPYPSTVTVEKSSSPGQSEPQLRFPPPDLVEPVPPPPSLSEELGPDFVDSTASSSDLSPTNAVTHQGNRFAPDSGQGVFPQPSAQPYANSPGGYPSGPATNPAVSPGQGSYAYPAPSAPPARVWPSQPSTGYSGNTYPGNSWSTYPYYGYPSTGYGYSYPGTGYGTNPGWTGDNMQTPFGTMPGPWDSMPRSFFPGR